VTAIHGGGADTTTSDVVAWLRAMPAEQRERMARLLSEPGTRAAIRDVREEAVVEMLAQEGSTWLTVATAMGVSVSLINKLVSAHNERRRAQVAAG
jgi:hypothetical protein